VADCSYKDHFINSVKKGGQGIAAVSGLTQYPSRRTNSGSLAKFAAVRRASSRVSGLVAERRCGAPRCPQMGDKRKSLAHARNDVNDPNRTSTGRFCCDALCVPVMERFGPQGREEKMGRKFIDCREYPSEMNCTLALSADNEDELLEAAVQHAITVHGHEDTPDLRTMIRTAMRDGTPPVEAPRRAA
jgi:predicted small metal-binding protein